MPTSPTTHYSMATLVPRGLYATQVLELLAATRDLFASTGDRELIRDEMDTRLRAIVAAEQVPANEFFQVLRVALSWPAATPDLFELMIGLGRDGVLQRVDIAMTRLTDEAAC